MNSVIDDLSFEEYNYYPALRTRGAELKGLGQLFDRHKDAIIPLLTLGKWPRAQNFETVADKIPKIFPDRPYFLDLTKEANTFTDQLIQLKDPAGGFKNWIDFVSRYEYAIPVLQSNTDQSIRDFIKQAQNCEKKFGKLAFRVSNFHHDLNATISALAALDEAENALVFIDVGYIRNSYTATVTATSSLINDIRDQVPNAIISTLATSFPASVATYATNGGRSGILDIMERQLHEDIGGFGVAAYGDYGSIHGVIYDDTPEVMRWAARVDYPIEREWYFERRPKDTSEAAFRDAAKVILRDHPEIANETNWGEYIINRVATEPNFSEIGFGPTPWIAVRVNIHISKQIEYTATLLDLPEPEWDEDLDF